MNRLPELLRALSCARHVAIVAPAFLAVAALPAAAEAPPLASLHTLARESPRKIAYEVSRESSPDGAEWIRMRADYETAYPCAIGDIVALIRDYEAGPEVFSRVGEVRLRSDDGRVAVTEQTSVVRVLGLTFVSKLTFLNSTEWKDPAHAILSFRAIESDGSAYSSEGSWELESVALGGAEGTYLRYRAETWVEPRFPGQEGIMRAFGAADFKRVLRELGDALERRVGRKAPPLQSLARPRMAIASA